MGFKNLNRENINDQNTNIICRRILNDFLIAIMIFTVLIYSSFLNRLFIIHFDQKY